MEAQQQAQLTSQPVLLRLEQLRQLTSELVELVDQQLMLILAQVLMGLHY
jgi:hypothetical protein